MDTGVVAAVVIHYANRVWVPCNPGPTRPGRTSSHIHCECMWVQGLYIVLGDRAAVTSTIIAIVSTVLYTLLASLIHAMTVLALGKMCRYNVGRGGTTLNAYVQRGVNNQGEIWPCWGAKPVCLGYCSHHQDGGR